tara:strand:- start:24 stop:665 length:642 start_codon:yes stop_codon:yes gene_type:complete
MNKMVLVVVTGVAVLATTVSANPAMDFFSNLKYGLRAGGNMASTSSSVEVLNKNSRMGFSIGGVAIYEPSDALSFTSELQYSMKGVEMEGSIEGSIYSGNYTATSKLNYLNVPVYVTYKIPQGVAGFRFNVFAGGYVSYLLSAKNEFVSFDFIEETDIKDTVYDGDYGLLLGVGTTYNDMVSVDLRYELGFKEISTNFGKNRNITLGVSFLFN